MQFDGESPGCVIPDFELFIRQTDGKLTAIFAIHWSRILCWYLGSCRKHQARVHCAKKALKQKSPIQIEPFLLCCILFSIRLSSCTVMQQTGAATLWSALVPIGQNSKNRAERGKTTNFKNINMSTRDDNNVPMSAAGNAEMVEIDGSLLEGVSTFFDLV
jgi:hypothetical protein